MVSAPPDKMALIEQAIKAIDMPRERDGSPNWERAQNMRVYRMVNLDPEAVLKLLDSVGGLGPTTRVEVDKANKSLLVSGHLTDHLLVKNVLDKLDGSGRKFYVMPLRRLEADYVAGTIEFMMGNPKKDEGQNNRRSYFFGYDPFGQQDQAKNDDQFRVEGDVEFRRLLIKANEVEMAEIRNLLVQLGEIPDEGGNRERTRVIPVNPGKDTEELLRRLRAGWIGPNPIEVDAEAEASPGQDTPAKREESNPPAPGAQTAPTRQAAERPLPMGGRTNGPPSPVLLAAADAKAQPEQGEAVADVDPEVEERARQILERFKQNADSAGQPAPGSLGEDAAAGSKTPPPIRITRGPNGLVITSNDTRALDQLQDLIDQVQPQRDDFKIFHLKYAYALSVKLNLEDIFDEDENGKDSNRRMPWYYYEYNNNNNASEKPSRLSQRRKIKFIDDYDTNTILVKNADPVQLRKVEDIIKFYDKPEPADSQSIRKIEIFKLAYAKAPLVAEVIKEVYRDLLSANDKALQTNGQQQQQEERRVYYYDNWGDGDESNDTKMPKFKGLLSIGIDAPSNSLIVSAPEFLMRGLKEIIGDLDEAAKPSSTLQVVKVGQYLKGKENRAALARMIGASKAASQGQEGDKGENGQGEAGGPQGGQQGQNGGQQGNQ